MILSITALVFAIGAVAAEYARTLMMVQQNSYRQERYRRYLSASGESTSVLKLVALVVFFFSLAMWIPQPAALGAQTGFYIWAIVSLWRKSRRYKKPLVWTPRARRIFAVMWVLTAIIAVAASLTPYGIFAGCCVMPAAFFASPAIAIAALWLLRPVEARINRRFVDDAARILRSMPGLTVVGITGSYGKTSTKHYLNRILSEQFSVCMTPGSFNTTMGVVRTVREHLKPYNQVFICEMGAKQPGDIREICDLVHPAIGIVTAVGPQHLESFKTIENVQRTKFELIDALPAGGLAVVNDDFEHIANRPVDNVEVVRYGIKPRSEVRFAAGAIEYSPSGTDFTIIAPDGDELRLHTRLVGECNVSNLIAAVVVALHLGVDRRRIAFAVEQIEQVEHRLSIRRTPGGLTIIDDAFNSNPTGSAMALDVLSAMPRPRIVITPGMIELGPRQEELNREFGRHIARTADVAIVVGRYNRDAILGGIGDAHIEVHAVDTFADAQAILASKTAAGATVLYENDLPDTFK